MGDHIVYCLFICKNLYIESKALNGIKLSLGETDTKKYDIYYQTHLSWIGWQEWKKNGEVAGDKPGSHIEAVRIKLVEK